ncbi:MULTISPECIES: ATP phosphoribosyltransferase [Oleiagrimonas]|uniref:ATP phosphoribosyltransferase n=1 Tax=Oleiagrimonas citrea TaxID=1665687 RepID=A0A846ZFE9_9GAMM|nr:MULTISPECIES: ATP phosphoribosyltransferase [Oleiagrimonas]NKZ37745.1 ATP phosphoribosyltransferase [Oleiagrimonas citrea]RAP56333.1 ATP phosphoribosyltransferase [Oleiagrimonas sp. MCCC 1A03011]
MMPRDRLRIAVQKSGRLGDPSRDLLSRCGLKFRSSRDKLFCFGENMAVDLLLVRDDDIPGLIADGVCDLGVVGRNVLDEAALATPGERSYRELRALGFGGCRLSIALPQDEAWTGPQQLAGKRIATTYPNQLADWLRRNEVDAQIVTLSGSVEIAPRLGTADLICDLVSSGATLAANQLRETAVIMQSEAVLAGAAEMPRDERGDLIELLLRRLDGVLNVRESRLLMLKAPRAALSAIVDLLPGRPLPTVTPIEGRPDDIALQCVCSGNVSWQDLEAMKRAGAQGMLVLPVEMMLA